MKKVKFFIGSLLVILFAFNACKKYEEGPGLSFRSAENRLMGTWSITKVTKDDKEMSKDGDFEFFYQTTFTFLKDNAGIYAYTDDDDEIDYGKIDWYFNKDKTILYIHGPAPKFIGVFNNEEKWSMMMDVTKNEIIKLTNEELIIKFIRYAEINNEVREKIFTFYLTKNK